MAYVTPTVRTTGDLITAAIWNQDVVANPIALSTALLIPPHVAGNYYMSQGLTGWSSITATAGRLYAIPITIPATKTYDRLIFASGAVGNVRAGIYQDNNGVPGALVLAAVEQAVGAMSTTITISQSLSGPARYWLALLFSGAPTSLATINGNTILGGSGGSSAYGGAYRTFAYAALPDPFGTITSWLSDAPNVQIRAA